MVSLTIYNASGSEVGTYDIDPAVIAPKISKQLLHDACVMYQANARMGTHRTKTRGEVAGHKKKLFRQKGTGNARMGHKHTNVRTGGGHGHALRPRDYGYKMPRKALQAATRMAIASKIIDGELVVIDELKFDAPATKQMAGVLKALMIDGRSALVATADRCVNTYKSGRNIAGVSVSPVADLNALSVIKPHRVLITKEALDRIRDGVFKQDPSVNGETESQAEAS
ncbi:MAG: 50S ribosomal protein L4 [Pirellulaceae bacterium]